VSGVQVAARSLDGRPACRGGAHDHLRAGHDNAAYPDSVSSP